MADEPRPDDNEPVEKTDIEKDEELLALARRRFRRADDGEGSLRARMLSDLVFSANLTGKEQWNERAIKERESAGRPWLTIDRMSHPIYSLINQHRDSGAVVTVQPVDQGADPETAEIFQGLIRNIEQQSRAHLAYMCGVGDAVRIGRGWVRIVPEYVAERSYDQDLRIKRVLNPFSVYPDVSAAETDYSDGNYFFVTQDLDLDEYKEEHGKESDIKSASDFTSIGDQAPLWFVNGHVRIAEYYYVQKGREKLITLYDPQNNPLLAFESEIPSILELLQKRGMPTNLRRGPQERDNVITRQIKWCKINGVEILKKRDVPGKWIPIVPIIGEELFVNGERDFRGIVRGAKDAVRTYQVQVTALIEAVGLIPKAPFIAAAGQIKGFESFWKDANVNNYSVLPYQEIDINGNMVPPPQRNPAMPPLSPLVAAIAQMDNDVKAATRFYDASLGKPGPEESGVALSQRRQQGSTGTSHFEGNFRDISLSHIGRILVDLIPYYYDTARVARITGLDNQPKTVVVNKPFTNEQGIQKIYRLGVGNYDVAVLPGPGFETKRQETRELLTNALQANPGMFQFIGDLYMQALGLPDIAKRLAKVLPPELREPQEGDPPVSELRQQLEQLQQQAQGMSEALQAAQQEIETGKMKLMSAEKIAAAQVEQKHEAAMFEYRATIAKMQAQIEAKSAQLQFQVRIEEIKAILEREHDERMAEKEAAKPAKG